MKKTLYFFLIMSVFVTVHVGLLQAADQPITNISVISAPFGTGSYVLSTALEDISKKFHPWLRITASETPGLVFNTKKLSKEPDLKSNTIMSYTVGINWLATTGGTAVAIAYLVNIFTFGVLPFDILGIVIDLVSIIIGVYIAVSRLR